MVDENGVELVLVWDIGLFGTGLQMNVITVVIGKFTDVLVGIKLGGFRRRFFHQ